MALAKRTINLSDETMVICEPDNHIRICQYGESVTLTDDEAHQLMEFLRKLWL